MPDPKGLHVVPGFIDYRFYAPFKHLMYMAAWLPDKLSKPSHRKLFFVYSFLVYLAVFTFFCLQLTDLHFIRGNLKKVTFNLCSSSLVFGVTLKMIILFHRRKKIKELQYNLWMDSVNCDNKEDVAILEKAFKKFKLYRNILYSGPCTVIPLWGITAYFSYIWGPRLLPFAAYFPMKDFNNDITYLPALIYEIFMGYLVAQTVVESDLVLFGLIVQIEAHYQILCKNLIKISEEYEGHEREVNGFLRTGETLRKLRAIVKRHMRLLQYCEDVEYVFNRCMALQLIGGSFVILMNGIETTRRMAEISFSLCFQMMYLIFVMLDIYFICYHFTALTAECTNLGNAAYGTSWYNMDIRVKKTLMLIMARAQKPPKFTYGKLFPVDVNAYMHLVKNIYSWLMLFRQLI